MASSSSSSSSSFALDRLESLSNELDEISFLNRKLIHSKTNSQLKSSSTSTSESFNKDSSQDLDSILNFDFVSISNDSNKTQHSKSTLPTLQILKSSLDQLVKQTSTSSTPSIQTAEDDEDLIPLARIVYATLSLTLETLLNQAEQVQDQAFYWTKVEDSTSSTLLYLIQS